jgi:hypothetical protein
MTLKMCQRKNREMRMKSVFFVWKELSFSLRDRRRSRVAVNKLCRCTCRLSRSGRASEREHADGDGGAGDAASGQRPRDTGQDVAQDHDT